MSPDWNRDVGELSINQKFMLEKIIMEYVKREKKLEKNSQTAYLLTFRQCTKHIRSRLESHRD